MYKTYVEALASFRNGWSKPSDFIREEEVLLFAGHVSSNVRLHLCHKMYVVVRSRLVGELSHMSTDVLYV